MISPMTLLNDKVIEASVSVIKLGSSVLVDATCVAQTARELQRCVSLGNKVIAVVSAFAGETDRLFNAVAKVDESADPHRIADFVATGEAQSACLLRIALESIDVSAKAILPSDCGLLAAGDPLDADPQDVNVAYIKQLFEKVDVIVLPGFIACDNYDRSVLLGRGGSDNTALFLAQRLNAHCRLVKDVDGIFEYDPARRGPPPRQFQSITWQDAIEVAGELVQPKAILFAESHAMQFKVSALESNGGSTIGIGPTKFRNTAELVDHNHHTDAVTNTLN